MLASVTVRAQNNFLPPAPHYYAGRLQKIVITEAAVGTVFSVGLNLLWYKSFPRSHFHLFNDNSEWLQMDKAGHATTAYTIAVMQNDLLRWCGVRRGPSLLMGAATALTYMSAIEVMDGFSTHWGFSLGDMVANLSGITLFAAQQAAWKEQRIALKFSFHFTPLAAYHPEELGKRWPSRILKDYNGQTYWLSFNPSSFLNSSTTFPAWLNMDVGYGADGMTGASENPVTVDGKEIPPYKRLRQYYLSPDINMRAIPSRGFASTAFYLLQFAKFPAPSLEYNQNKTLIFHTLYY